MNLRIVPAQLQDIPSIFSLIQELAEFEALTQYLTGTETDLKDSLFGDHPAAECVVAWVDDQIVGYALFFHNFSTFQCKSGLYLEDLYVKPDHRGKGIGKALFSHVQQIGKSRGCGRFEWLAVRDDKRAIQFYKSLGATVYDQFRLCRMTYDQSM